MPPFTYEDVISTVECFPIRRGLTVFVNVTVWKNYIPDRFFDVVKFTTLTPLPLLISCKLSFPTV